MSSIKNMCAYLQKAMENRAKLKGPEDVSDNEAGVLKEAKKVALKTVPESSGPITAKPLNMAPHDAGASPAKKPKSRRQRQTSPEGSNTSANKRLKGSSDEGFVSWTDTMNEFTGEGKVKSLWDSRFPVSSFVAEHLWTEDDFSRVASVGPDQAAIAMQAYGLRIASMGHMFGNELATLRLQERTARHALDAAKKTLAALPDLQKENSKLKAENERLKKAMEESGAEVERLKKAMEEAETARKEKEDLLQGTYDDTVKHCTKKMEEIRAALDAKTADLVKKDQEIETLGLQSADFLLNGFDKARGQIAALYPDLDLSKISVFKTVIDGQVVDEPEEPEVEKEVGVKNMEVKPNEITTEAGESSSLIQS